MTLIAKLEAQEKSRTLELIKAEMEAIEVKIKSGYIVGEDLVHLRRRYMEKNETYQKLKSEIVSLCQNEADEDYEDIY